MAAASVNSCDICMHEYNKADRKSVALPCDHDFCLTCLVRLKTSGSHKCPKCPEDWAELEVEALPGMEDVEGTSVQQVEEEELGEKGKKGSDLCLNHQFPCLYWCVDENEFHCKKCIVEKRCLHLELIDEAIPLVKTDLNRRVTENLENFQTDFEELEKIKREVSGKLHLVKQCKEAVQKLEDYLQDYHTKIELLMDENRKSSSRAEDIRGRIEEVKSQLDVPLMVKSRTTLEALSKPAAVPDAGICRALLCNIACTYMEVTRLEGPPSEAAFICGLLKTSGSSVGPLTEVVRAAEELKGGTEWHVYSSNTLAALLALADRQPSVLTLTASRDEPEALPAVAVAAVAKAARDCDTQLYFFNSFYAPQDPKRDFERLDHIVKNSSLRITLFYGHLDEAGIEKLPRSIVQLGLAIGSAADARAVSGLRPWEGLRWLAVSVSCGVAAQDLRPLPSVPGTWLCFSGLTDARVDSVRPAIEALMGGRSFNFLCLHSCQLTAGGARRLARLLRGAGIGGLRIETSGPWRPGAEEKRSVGAELGGVVGCEVKFVSLKY